MGEVYRADSLTLVQPVALKFSALRTTRLARGGAEETRTARRSRIPMSAEFITPSSGFRPLSFLASYIRCRSIVSPGTARPCGRARAPFALLTRGLCLLTTAVMRRQCSPNVTRPRARPEHSKWSQNTKLEGRTAEEVASPRTANPPKAFLCGWLLGTISGTGS